MRTELLTVVVITAENDVVDVHLLGDLIEADAGEMSGERNAGSIEGVSAVLTGNKIKAATSHARPQDFREGFGNPFEPGSFGRVLKRKDEKRIGRSASAAGCAGLSEQSRADYQDQ